MHTVVLHFYHAILTLGSDQAAKQPHAESQHSTHNFSQRESEQNTLMSFVQMIMFW